MSRQYYLHNYSKRLFCSFYKQLEGRGIREKKTPKVLLIQLWTIMKITNTLHITKIYEKSNINDGVESIAYLTDFLHHYSYQIQNINIE